MYRSRGIKTGDGEIADALTTRAAGDGGIVSLPLRGARGRDIPRSHVRP
ncbi:hypothetical protein [Mesorhizobium sp. ANAO-SY3R2]